MIPTMIGRLTSLRTLPFFSVGEDESHKIEELGGLSKLRGTLIIYDLQHVKDEEEAKRAKIFEKPKITELEFCWERNPRTLDINYEVVLEGLKPHKNLKGLILRHFGGRRLASWMGRRDDQLLHYLVKIKLIDCKLCEEIPILGHLLCLEVIEMVHLDNVESIGPEFYGLDKGVVGGNSIVVFPALRQLTIYGMQNLKEWSDIPPLPPATMSRVEFFPCLEELRISECPNLIAIPGHLLSIQDLHIGGEIGGNRSNYFKSDIKEKSYIPRITLQVDPDSENIGTLIEHLLESSSKSLRLLQIMRLNKLRHLPKHLLNLASLEALAIVYCPKLMHMREETGADVNRLTSLREILIQGCGELTCLPKVLLQPTLVSLELRDCDNLMVPYELCNLTSLQKLSISNCEKLTCFPKGLLQPTLLSLEISGCRNLMAANPDELRNLTSLEELELVRPNSRWARCWVEGQFCLTSLRTLYISYEYCELDYFPWPEVEMDKAQNPQHYPLASLESLSLEGWPKLKCLPVQLGYLTSLRKLVISEFDGLEALPEWLGNFSSLESLMLLGGSSLRSLPSLERFQLLKNLHSLVIFECPLLKERCMEGKEEWYKITSIPSLKVYGYLPDHITI